MKESKGKKSALLGDCVFEDSKQVTQAETDPKTAGDLAPEIQRLYVRDYKTAWREFLNGYSVVPYASPADAAKKLEILSSNRSPLLALFAVTANETNIPDEWLPRKVEDIKEKVGAAVGIGAQTKAPSKPQSSAEDITQFFQPVHEVVPPKSQLWVTEKISAYMDALARLRGAMQAIANSTDAQTRLAANQAASPIKESALDTVRQLAMRFHLNGLDQDVQRLLREPIEQSAKFIQTDPVPITANEINDKLRQLCKSAASVFEKFPFRGSSPQDATLEELSALFAPEAGQIWKFQMGSLAALTQLENSQWKLKDPSAKPQITPEMLAFLNRAQLVKDGFYPKGATRPQLTYSLRPELDSSFKGATVEVEVDGQSHEWTTVFQKEFTWPAAAEKKPGAIARVRTTVAYAFTSHGGVWGIFRMMADAEPRAPKSPNIEWKYIRLGGQQDPIQPAPVRMSFPEFPNGIDVFHPQFLEGIKCPASAVR